MSDESAPPPLRLKPRAQPPVEDRRPAAVPAVSNVAEVPPPTSLAKEHELPKLRVKLRLPELPALVLIEPMAVPEKGPMPALAALTPIPPPSSAATEVPSGDGAKFKLKPKTPAGLAINAPPIPPIAPAAISPAPSPTSLAPASAPVPTIPVPSRPPGFGGSPANLAPPNLESGILAPVEEDASAPKGVSISTISDLQVSETPLLPTSFIGSAEQANPPPPFPVVSPSTTIGGLPRSVHVGAAEQIFGGPPVGDVKPEHQPGFKLGVSIAIAILAVAVGVGIFFGWKHFRPAPETTVTQPAAPVSSSAGEPSGAAAAPASTENSAALPDSLAKLREFAATQRIQEQARIDALATGSDISGKTIPPGTSLSAKNPSAATTVLDASELPMALAPGVTAQNPSVAVSDASPAFRTFVANVKITGVFQGDPPRAFIDGRTVRVGEFVNVSLGISFDSVDPEKKQIVFKDRSGVTITRRY